VSLVIGVDRAADFGHPQRDAVMLEQGDRQPVLVAVERAVRLADDDGIEPAVSVPELGEQRSRLRPALPGDRAGLVHVEELSDDNPAARLDESAGTDKLPPLGRLWVLLVLSRYPALKRELDHAAPFLTASLAGEAGRFTGTADGKAHLSQQASHFG
jgi:hypothetical protein